jgi:hypothetical protein
MKDFQAGKLIAVPAATTNGTPLITGKHEYSGVLIELASGDSITYAVTNDAPSSAPSPTVTRSGAEVRRVDEPLGPDMMVYVTAKTGSPSFRFY